MTGFLYARSALTLLLLLASAGGAAANDSAAEQAAGGLRLVENEDVALEREGLFISAERIEVSYVFRNLSAEDAELTVAFPLPVIEGELAMSPVDLPFPEDENFVGFTVEADGASVEPRLEERAFLGERDVTQLLAEHALPLNPLSRKLETAVAKLGSDTRRRLEQDGLIEPDSGFPLPNWRYEAQFFWTQLFPAGETVAIRHAYRPVRGMYFVERTALDDPDYLAKYCVDPGTKRALRGLIRKAAAALVETDPGSYAELAEDPDAGLAYSVAVPYILTTANNWAGPIGSFELVIDKGSPEAIVSLCQPGIRKTGPTRFEWSAEDYVPERDLLVLFAAADPVLLGIR